MNPKTVRTVMNNDLGLKSYTEMSRHLLTVYMKVGGLDICKKVLSHIKNYGPTVKISSDTIFTLKDVLNCRNVLYTESKVDVKGAVRNKNPARVITLGVVTSHGEKTPSFFYKL